MSAVFRYRELIRNLILQDLKLKYRDSVFGFLWSLANPLLMITVYTLAFRYIIQVQVPNFVLFLLVGFLHWNLFSQALITSTTCVLGNAGLIKKVPFPLEVLPISTACFSLVQYLLALVVFMPAIFFYFGVRPSWVHLLFLPLLMLQFLLVIGLGMALSTATVFYRDVKHFVELALMMLFWMTPIIYDISSVPAGLKPWILLNPFTSFILGYQSILYHSRMPDLMLFLDVAIYTTIAFAFGSLVFNRFKARFAEEI